MSEVTCRGVEPSPEYVRATIGLDPTSEELDTLRGDPPERLCVAPGGGEFLKGEPDADIRFLLGSAYFRDGFNFSRGESYVVWLRREEDAFVLTDPLSFIRKEGGEARFGRDHAIALDGERLLVLPKPGRAPSIPLEEARAAATDPAIAARLESRILAAREESRVPDAEWNGVLQHLRRACASPPLDEAPGHR